MFLYFWSNKCCVFHLSTNKVIRLLNVSFFKGVKRENAHLSDQKRSIKSLEYQKQRYPPTVRSGIKEMEKKCMKKRGEGNPHPLVPVACLWPVDDLSLHPLFRPLTISLHTLPWRTVSNSYHTYLSLSISLSYSLSFLHYRGGP